MIQRVILGSGNTTTVIERHLLNLQGATRGSADPVIRELLSHALTRIRILSTTLLVRRYPRLLQPPMGVQADEVLSNVVERLMKALREVRPDTVRQFFALANQHIRWELNDLCRRLDQREPVLSLEPSVVASPPPADETLTTVGLRRILSAIEDMPADLREPFDLVRVQGLTQVEAAQVIGVSIKTLQRRLSRGVSLLAEQLADMVPPAQGKKGSDEATE
ncbi:MAG: sigma-70 family RNA polymerase sigma factor [Tepidisphaeraceae bacterium]